MSVKLPGTIIKEANGAQHTILLLNNGTVYGFGDNGLCQLGLGGNTDSSIKAPTKLNISNVKDITCGDRYTMFLLNDGTVYGCGDNTSGQLGLGNTDSPITTPAKLSISNIKKIECGSAHTVFLLNDGTVYECGYNPANMADGVDLPPITTPAKLDISNVKDVSCFGFGDTTVFLLNDGTVYGYGDNSNGQLGLGDTVSRPTLTKLNIENVKSIGHGCTSAHIIFILNDGTVYGCGFNLTGTLGIGDTTATVTVPTKIDISNVKDVVYEVMHTMFLLNDGTVYGCGRNSYGELGLGDGTTSKRLVPTKTCMSNVKEIVCGKMGYTIFRLNDGSLYGCGFNAAGQLGLGNVNNPINIPTLIVERVEASPVLRVCNPAIIAGLFSFHTH